MKIKIATIAVLLILVLSLAGCVEEDTDTSGIDDVDEPVDVPDKVDEKDCKTITETYTAQIPYNETEYYYVKEGVGREYCEDKPYTDIDVNVNKIGSICDVTVKNTGDLAGNWTLHVKYVTTSAGGGPESEQQTKELLPGDSYKFRFQYDGDREVRDCQHYVDASPFTSVCHYSFYQDVRKSRIVTKYREEERTREKLVCD